MDDLEELKARSTTQYRDEMKRAGITDKDLDAFDYDLDLDADYEPESYDPDDEPGDAESDDPGILPGIVQAILPRQQRQHEDRERSPRRHPHEARGPPSDAPTALPLEPEQGSSRVAEGSPKRKHHLEDAAVSYTHLTLPTKLEV